MSEFLEQRISSEISYGSSWADDWAVQITVTAAGAEHRSLLHPYPMRRFRLQLRSDLTDIWSEVLNLYARAYGRFAGFRAKAFDDFTTRPDGRSAPTALDQTLLRVSSGVYQLRKEYGLDAAGLGIGRPVRTIYKPVSGTTVCAKNGVAIGSGVTVNTVTGVVTISPAPLITDVITGGCEFDIPVRFDGAVQVEQIRPDVRIMDCELIELLAP